jgi:hypothetical protein
MAVRKLAWGMEGGVSLYYLLVNDGSATLIYDWPTDPDGPVQRKVTSSPVTAVRLIWRSYDAATRTWREADYSSEDKPGAGLKLKLVLPSGGTYYF